MNIAKSIRTMREHNGYTQVEVAKRIGIAQPTMASIEMGLRSPSLNVAYLLAKMFHCKVDDFLKHDKE